MPLTERDIFKQQYFNLMPDIIEIENLSKKFGGFTALKNISLDIKKGDSFAVLGPNGAGKTTLIRILSTLIKPTSGTVRIDGVDIIEDPLEVKKMIGVVSHDPYLYNELTARENLEFFIDLYECRADPEELLEKVNLKPKADNFVSTFSRGMKQRLSIARSVVHNPKLLLLDEPTVGLDIKSRKDFYKMINDLNKKGTTIILTTHFIEDAEVLCKNGAIIDSGQVETAGKLIDIKGRVIC